MEDKIMLQKVTIMYPSISKLDVKLNIPDFTEANLSFKMDLLEEGPNKWGETHFYSQGYSYYRVARLWNNEISYYHPATDEENPLNFDNKKVETYTFSTEKEALETWQINTSIPVIIK
jgi:hypothetical protein